MPSVSFDRTADRYDATRGGLRRGKDAADVIARHARPGAIVEVGVGTGGVALALLDHGHPVAGFDLSPRMLMAGRWQLGPRAAVADGYELPVRTSAVPNVAIVWVFQLVPDVPGLMAEAARVVAPGGRVMVVPSGGRWEPDDVGEIIITMARRLRPMLDTPEQIIAAAEVAGLALVAHDVTAPATSLESPEASIRTISKRVWPSLWDVDDNQWAAIVAPAIAALEALPDPTRPRRRVTRFDVLVFESPE
jgi:ubiquinone/menaquinone biosynthesis C-methylase UbiE